ncbi:hypothetical protein PVAND_004674 [Polypedilum vanderplanki]|uniref:Glutaredoxin-2, mitochondrial n=1 Tax=Polypedilum vanderplanki TaxID=319348 RepID=A0A9J6BY97_POLVA|nr:hypothetical protein PVAND_004674 [Polypedilum vanderplanki]
MGSTSTKLNPVVEEFVKNSLNQQRVVIFSKSYCPYCKIAKDQFKKLNVDYLAIEIENRPDCNEIQSVLGSITGAKTVPRVFIDGRFIGGGDQVKKLYETGELAKLLN